MSSPLPSILIILAPFPLFELSLPLLSETCLLYYITVVYFPTFPYLTQTYFFEHLKWWLHFFLTSVYLSNRKCSLSIWKLNWFPNFRITWRKLSNRLSCLALNPSSEVRAHFCSPACGTRWLGPHLDHWIFLLRKDSLRYIFTFLTLDLPFIFIQG